MPARDEDHPVPGGYRRFSKSTAAGALRRQENLCASCGTTIVATGNAAAADHKFGERAEAHHVIPHKMGGPATEDNCVVLCRACHLNAHQGGQWGDLSIYEDLLGLPVTEMIATIAGLYPHYRGRQPQGQPSKA
jgi:hypothetical protein